MKNKNNDLSWSIYKYGFIIIVLQSFGCWLFWSIDSLIVAFVFFLISFVFISYHNDWKDPNPVFLRTHFFYYLIALFLYTFGNTLYGWAKVLLLLFPLYVLFLLRSKYKEKLLALIRFVLVILISISVIAWILFLTGVNLPHSIAYYGNIDGVYQYEYENYYFFLRNISSTKALLIPRFCSVFIEPGYLGCLMALLIYQGDYKFNKRNYENWVFLSALLLTLSLAGYILLALGYSLKKVQTLRGIVMSLVFISFFIFIFIPFLRNYNNGSNYVNMAILERLEYDENKGTLSGYNRSSGELDENFWKSFVFSGNLLFGDKTFIEKVSDRSNNEVSWTAYIINYGLIAFVFLTLYFFYPAFKIKRRKLDHLGFSLLFFLIFCQTIHMTHSIMYISLFVFGIDSIRNKYKHGVIEKTKNKQLINI